MIKQVEELYVGLMSGSSVDGIDAALVAFESAEKLRVIETAFTPFPADIRAEITNTALNNSDLFKNQDSALHQQLATHYAQASLRLIDKAAVSKKNVCAIANHGQTVRHAPNDPEPFSLQLGDGQLIANQTGLKVITQFRQTDIEVGGQGAPLMPAFHARMFKQEPNNFILNLGGIANISRLSEPVIGFDTGPSNTLMDQWVEHHLGLQYDADGQWAKSGKVVASVLERLLTTPYLHAAYPKSTGTDYFNLSWLNKCITDLVTYRPEDIQATLLTFTVKSIKLALQQLDAHQGKLYVCGGGANNTHMMRQLAQELTGYQVEKTDAVGVPSDWVEAVGFAWLGYCKRHGIPSNLPSVTGASKPVVLGKTYTPQ